VEGGGFWIWGDGGCYAPAIGAVSGHGWK
jgi:hypothetical protein